MKKQDIKEFLEITEAIFTIVVSIIAVWGTLHAWESGFLNKLHKIVEYNHARIVNIEKSAEKDL
ncbi:MAG: hypothetical protein R3Y43_00035 [Alphaproteobacteria bacterium]